MKGNYRKGTFVFCAIFLFSICHFVSGDDDLLQRDLKQLKNSDPAKRAEAAWDLGHYKETGAVPALTAALKDPDGDVRANAAGAL